MQTKFTLTGETCVYLYGIVASRSLGPQGLEDMLHGIEDASGMFLIEAGNLACVAVCVQSSEYRDRLREDASNQLAWLGPRALRHHEILRNLHEITTVVPFKFGTLCESTGEVQHILQQLQEPFTRLLKHFEGREEWAVRVFVDESATMRHLEETNSQLIGLRVSGPDSSPGEAYFLQKRRQKLAADLVNELIFSLGEGIEQRLVKSAVQIVRNTAAANECDRSKVAALSAAVLLEKSRFEALEAILEQLESEYACYLLSAEISGPWPPYSFSTDLDRFQNSGSPGVVLRKNAVGQTELRELTVT